MLKTLLITGSGGFVGKNLKKYFDGKYNLLLPRSYELDLIDKKAVDDYFSANSIDAIVHCGSVGGVRDANDRDTTIEDNLAMVENLLSAKNKDVKLVLFGSGAMYDRTRQLKKVDEAEIGKFIPSELYGLSKVEIANKVKDRTDCVCLNIFACYGYDEKETRFPSDAIINNLNKRDIVINRNVVFDYLFVEDMQKIVEYVLENKVENNILNITPSKSISLYEIAEIVNENSDFKSQIIVKDENLGNEYTGSNIRLLNEFKNLTFTSYKDGLKKLRDYISTSAK